MACKELSGPNFSSFSNFLHHVRRRNGFLRINFENTWLFGSWTKFESRIPKERSILISNIIKAEYASKLTVLNTFRSFLNVNRLFLQGMAFKGLSVLNLGLFLKKWLIFEHFTSCSNKKRLFENQFWRKLDYLALERSLKAESPKKDLFLSQISSRLNVRLYWQIWIHFDYFWTKIDYFWARNGFLGAIRAHFWSFK